VVIVDGDLGLANVDVVLGINPRYTLEHVIRRQRSLDEIVVAGPPNVRVVPGGSGLAELANLSDQQRQALIHGLERLGRSADYLLIDTAAGVSRDVSEFVLAAQEALIITTPEPTAIADAYALIKVVTRESSNFVVHLVVNQAVSAAEAADVALKVGAVSQRFLQVSVDCPGYLPTDPAVAQAVRRQTPVLLAYPRSPFSRMIYALARQIDGRRLDLDRDDGVLTFLRRMMRGRNALHPRPLPTDGREENSLSRRADEGQGVRVLVDPRKE